MRYSSFVSLCAAALAACGDEFSTEPPQRPTLESLDWPAELHMTDVDTIEIDARLGDPPVIVTGLRVTWESTNPNVVSVTPVPPPAGGSREDTLLAQRRAVVRGIAAGRDTVKAIIEAGAAFERVELHHAITVTQKWISVSAGEGHTCGITVDSAAYCWGIGSSGALGSGRPTSSARPLRVVSVGDLKFVTVAAGDLGTCGVTADEVAFCWGSGAGGRLGNNDPSESSQFTPVPVFGGNTFESVEGGARVFCGVVASRDVFCWGDNSSLQVGFVPTPFLGLDTCIGGQPCSRRPRQVSSPAAQPNDPFRASSVDVGGVHSCAIATGSSRALCWGNAPTGALGAGGTTASAAPLAVSGGLSFATISAGNEHTCAMTSSRTAYCWGQGNRGQLGNASANASTTPLAVAGNTPFETISAGRQHTCALTADGVASCWGLALNGQLGNGSTTGQANTPVAVQGGLRFRAVSAGAAHTCGVTLDGSMYCWGSGLATGSAAVQSTPTRVPEP